MIKIIMKIVKTDEVILSRHKRLTLKDIIWLNIAVSTNVREK